MGAARGVEGSGTEVTEPTSLEPRTAGPGEQDESPRGRSRRRRRLLPRRPLRVEVYSDIAGRIRSGELAPGAQIPAEYDLVEEYGVSRTVIREAMILLEEDHWLENRPGNGRFVTSTVPDLGLSRLRPINDLLAEQVGRTSARLLRIVGEPATEFVAAGLDVHAGAPTVLAEYLIVEEASSKPLAYCLDWIPASLMARDALAGGFAGSVLGTLIADGVTLDGARMTIDTGTAGSHRAHLLGIQPSHPILLLEMVVTDAGGRPVLTTKHHLRSDVATLSIALEV